MNIERIVARALRLLAAGLFGMVGFASVASAEDADQGNASPCRRSTFEGKRYVVCSIDVHLFEIRLAWGERGTAFGTIGSYLRQLSPAERPRLTLAMNAGMYEPDLRPVGLLIERGRELAAPNVSSGSGNFYWKPNGVFFAGEGRVGILDTAQFLKAKPRAEYATQSGPMLVRHGVVGERMLASASSKNIRNGVGVRDEHTAIFVISEDLVSFAEFARFFRDGLSCSVALYLDGTISQLYAPSIDRTDQHGTVGPIVAAFERPVQTPAK